MTWLATAVVVHMSPWRLSSCKRVRMFSVRSLLAGLDFYCRLKEDWLLHILISLQQSSVLNLVFSLMSLDSMERSWWLFLSGF